MKRKYLYILPLCVFIILVLLLVVRYRQTNSDIYIFSDMAECAQITAGTDSGDFTVYADPSADKNLNGLSYADFFAGKCSCDLCTYEIFAYVFHEESQAQAYFQAATGKSGSTNDPNFSLVAGITSTNLTVLKGNMVYRAEIPVRDTKYVLQHLANVFSVKIC